MPLSLLWAFSPFDRRSEKDIDEVLQIHTVYHNISKGEVAKSADLLKAFGTDDHDQVCLEVSLCHKGPRLLL